MKKDDINEIFNTEVSFDEMNDRQIKILEAAIKIFSEKGYDATRTSEIAKEAGVAEGTIFRYYKTKKDLLVGLITPLIINFFKPMIMKPLVEIMDNKENLSIEEILKHIYIDRHAIAKQNMPLVKTIMMEAQYHPEILKPLQEDIAPYIIPLVDDFFNQLIVNKQIRELNPRLITRSFMSLLIGYNILTRLFPSLFSLGEEEEELESLVDIFLHGTKKESGE